MYRFIRLGALVLALSVIPAAAGNTGRGELPGSAGTDVSAVLRDDARLKAPLTLAAEVTPLGRALRQIQERTGVPLTAARDTADDKVTLFIDRLPAAQVLDVLARHFDFRWYRKGNGYELAQDAGSKRREAQARARAQAARIAALSARMSRIFRLARLPVDHFRQRQKDVDRRLPDRAASPEEREELEDERAAIADLGRPQARIFAGLWAALAPAQMARLENVGEVRLSTVEGTLPRGFQDAFVREGAEHYNQTVAPLTGEARDAQESADAAHVRIRVLDGAPVGLATATRGDHRLQLLFEAVTVHGATAYPSQWSPRIEDGAPEPNAEATATSDPALTRTVELTEVQLKELAGARQVTVGPARFARRETQVTLGGLARLLHRLAGLQVAADGFIRARMDAAPLLSRAGSPRRVVDLLDAAAEALDYAWQKEGPVVRFRSRPYYFDRPAEVPARILAPWLERHTGTRPGWSDPAADLAELGGLAAAMTDAQCRGLSEFWDWYTDGSGVQDPGAGAFVYRCREPLRFWVALTGVQRKAALAGSVVAARSFNLLQRQALARALLAPGADDDLHWWALSPTPVPGPDRFHELGLLGELQKFSQRSRRAPGGGTTTFPAYRVDLRIFQGTPRNLIRSLDLTRW
jgi:hypothetical protein